ncbi:MAG: hypothetical protein GY842_03045, partial [bacterium]|nr:hypothetical protein [bacterium]
MVVLGCALVLLLVRLGDATGTPLLMRAGGLSLSFSGDGGGMGYSHPFDELVQARAFAVEMWIRCQNPALAAVISIAMPGFLEWFAMLTGGVSIMNELLFAQTADPDGTPISIPEYYCGNRWDHFACSVNLTSGRLLFMLNGQALFDARYSPVTRMSLHQKLGASLVLGQLQTGTAKQNAFVLPFIGLLDEVRVWTHFRTASTVRGTYRQHLPHSAAAGPAQQWCFDDTAASSSSLVLGNVDHRWTEFPRYSVDAAPVGSAVAPAVVVLSPAPGSTVLLTEALWLNANTTVRIVTGTVLVQGVPMAAPVTVPPAQHALVEVGDGVQVVQYTVVVTHDAAATGNTTGTLRIEYNHRPVADDLFFACEEDVGVLVRLPGSDLDGSTLIPTVLSLPLHGSLLVLMENAAALGPVPATPILRAPFTLLDFNAVYFMPHQDAVGTATFEYTVRETLLLTTYASARNGTVTVRIDATNDAPEVHLNGAPASPATALALLEDGYVDFTVSAVDIDAGDYAVLQITQLPTRGTLRVNGRMLRDLQPTVQHVYQWVAEVVNISSELPPYLGDAWLATQLVGPPRPELQRVFGDSMLAWCPASPTNACVSRDPDYFYTEWMHLRVTTAVYVTGVLVYENMGAGAVTRVRALAPAHGGGGWATLWAGPATTKGGVYHIFAERLCTSPWRTRDVRVELNTCLWAQSNEIEAVMVTGVTDRPAGVVTEPFAFRYTPDADTHGQNDTADVLSIVASDCVGDMLRSSNVVTVAFDVMPVNDAPKVFGYTVGPLAYDHEHHPTTALPLRVSDGDSAVVDIYVTGLPTRGSLLAADGSEVIVNGTRLLASSSSKYNDSSNKTAVVLYAPRGVRATDCTASFRDVFRFNGFDGELWGDVEATTTIVGMNCASCPRGYVPSTGRCVSVILRHLWWIVGVPALLLLSVAGTWIAVLTRKYLRYRALYSDAVVAERLAEAIAEMRLEEAELFLEKMERKTKVQAAFLAIVAKLRYYRSYLPETCIIVAQRPPVEDDDDDAGADVTSATGASSSRIVSCKGSTMETLHVFGTKKKALFSL